MNITTIDVSEINNIKIGDVVKVISNISDDKNSIHSISEIAISIITKTPPTGMPPSAIPKMPPSEVSITIWED